MSASPRCVFVATLGGQPQVVTLALDRLLARGEPIDEAIVVHLSLEDPRYRHALRCVAEAFTGERYAGRHIRYRPLAVRAGALDVDDLRGERAVHSALDVFQVLIRQLKESDTQIHLCVAGGRRLLGMLALSAAMLYFDRADMIWHLSSSEAVRHQTAEGAVMHVASSADVQLVRVPVEPWGHMFPVLRGGRETSYAAAVAQRRREHDSQAQARCEQVVAQLTERQREVLECLVMGLTVQEISERLCIVLSTVHAHKKQIFAECAIAWNLPLETRADARWLRETFAPFFGIAPEPL